MPLKKLLFELLPLPSLFKSVVEVLLPIPVINSNAPFIAPAIFPPVAFPVFAAVLVAFAFLAAREPLFLAALVVSFRTTIKVSPIFLARVSSNSGLYPMVVPVLEAGNKLPKLAGVKFSGLGRMDVGVAIRGALSAVAQALSKPSEIANELKSLKDLTFLLIVIGLK